MKIHIVEAGKFKLDGGAMFGVVPRRMWEKLNPPDDNNMCTWSMRCLLIESGDSRILIDTGMGDKQDARFRSHFEPHGTPLLENLRSAGFSPEDITDVLLTHLHFDHVGGAVSVSDTGKLQPTFPKATYWSNEPHVKWALEPNERERASFLKENFVPLLEEGVLKMLPVSGGEWLEGIRLQSCYGHTEAMMIAHIPADAGTLIYCADLVASSHHIGLPYVMSYDVRPLNTIQEKEALYEKALAEDAILFFEHDPAIAAARLRRDDRGRVVLRETFTEEQFRTEISG